jgi:uncharacterized protein (TIGR02996 family)
MSDEPASATDLHAARTALAAGDGDGALRHLLAVWQITRSERVAEMIERLSERLVAARPRLQGGTPSERHVAWMTAVERADDSELGRLLPWLVEHRAAPSLERLEAVAGRHDPRIAAALVDAIAGPPFQGGSSFRFWRRVFQVLRDLRDPRAARRLAGLREGISGRLSGSRSAADLFVRGSDEVIAAAGASRAPPDDPTVLREVEALLEAMAPRVDGRQASMLHDERTEEGFLDAIAASPHDLVLRSVYADWLQDRGDPRGEFLALQLRPPDALSRREAVRMRRLGQTHWRAWLGPLGNVLLKQSFSWGHGFPHNVVFRHVTAAQARAVVGHRGWATVWAISSHGHVPLELFTHEVMRSLRIVRELRAELAWSLLHGPSRPIEALMLSWDWQYRGTPEEEWIRALADPPGLPRLRALGLPSQANPLPCTWWDWLAGTPLGRRIEHLEASAHPSTLAEWMRWLESAPPVLRSLGLHTPDTRIVLRRGPRGFRDGRVESVSPYPREDLAEALGTLAPGALESLDASGYFREASPATLEQLRRLGLGT